MSPRFNLSITVGLGLFLSGCISSGDPVDLIPVGLRTTFGAEDRNAATLKPMTAQQMLAKLRGEPIPADVEPAPSAPRMPSIPSASTQPIPPRDDVPPVKDEPSKSALLEITVRFEGTSADPRAEDGLRVQLSAARAAKLGGGEAVIRVGPAGIDKIASVSLAMKRGEAIRALLPPTIAKTADVAYAPTVEPGAARFALR